MPSHHILPLSHHITSHPAPIPSHHIPSHHILPLSHPITSSPYPSVSLSGLVWSDLICFSCYAILLFPFFSCPLSYVLLCSACPASFLPPTRYPTCPHSSRLLSLHSCLLTLAFSNSRPSFHPPLLPSSLLHSSLLPPSTHPISPHPFSSPHLSSVSLSL